jgi:hypothetical protein
MNTIDYETITQQLCSGFVNPLVNCAKKVLLNLHNHFASLSVCVYFERVGQTEFVFLTISLICFYHHPCLKSYLFQHWLLENITTPSYGKILICRFFFVKFHLYCTMLSCWYVTLIYWEVVTLSLILHFSVSLVFVSFIIEENFLLFDVHFLVTEYRCPEKQSCPNSQPDQ